MKKVVSMEKKVSHRARRGTIETAVLQTLKVVGVLTVATMAPNVVQLLKYANPDWVAPPNPRQRVRETLYRMKRKGLIEFVERSGRKIPILTIAGEHQAARIQAGMVRIQKPRRWDGRWRIVIFDVSEKRRHLRDTIRALVRKLGFMRLQDSVWVHPYDCEELIKLIKTDLHIGKEALYIIADAVEYDHPMREFFSLPQK